MAWLYIIGKYLIFLGLLFVIFSCLMIYFEYICTSTIIGLIVGCILLIIGIICILNDVGYDNDNNDNNGGGLLFSPISMLNLLNRSKVPLMA